MQERRYGALKCLAGPGEVKTEGGGPIAFGKAFADG